MSKNYSRQQTHTYSGTKRNSIIRLVSRANGRMCSSYYSEIVSALALRELSFLMTWPKAVVPTQKAILIRLMKRNGKAISP